jgi:AhpD family alkylhydroperoxidase
VARIALSSDQQFDIRNVWAQLSAIGDAWLSLSDTIYTQSTLPARERECARMRIAQINQCQMCLAVRFDATTAEGVDAELYAHVGDDRAWPGYSRRERLAMEYAERFATDHLGMDDDFWRRLRDQFSEVEVLELGVCIATWLGQGRLTQVLGLDVACGLGPAGDDAKLVDSGAAGTDG